MHYANENEMTRKLLGYCQESLLGGDCSDKLCLYTLCKCAIIECTGLEILWCLSRFESKGWVLGHFKVLYKICRAAQIVKPSKGLDSSVGRATAC